MLDMYDAEKLLLCQHGKEIQTRYALIRLSQDDRHPDAPSSDWTPGSDIGAWAEHQCRTAMPRLKRRWSWQEKAVCACFVMFYASYVILLIAERMKGATP